MAKNKRSFFNDNDSNTPSPRGRGRGRARGRGGTPDGFLRRTDLGGRGSLRGKWNPGRPVYHPMEEIDIDIQQWGPIRNGYNSPRGRERSSFLNRGSSTPVRRGSSDPPPRGGRGRGRGDFGRGAKSRPEPGASLSSLLYKDRPLLRPVIFVRSQYTATLFDEAEDIFEPVIESTTRAAESHVPTATKVARVFSGTLSSLVNDSDFDEEIEEVDFADMGHIGEQTKSTKEAQLPNVVEVEEKFTDLYIDTLPPILIRNKHPTTTSDENGEPHLATSGGGSVDEAMAILGETHSRSHSPEIALPPEAPPTQDTSAPGQRHDVRSTQIISDVKIQPIYPVISTVISVESPLGIEREWTHERPGIYSVQDSSTNEPEVVVNIEGNPPGFYLDAQPSQLRHQEQIQFDPIGQSAPLGMPQDDEDDVIVYDAPNPRSGHAIPGTQAPPKPPATTLADISFDNSPRPSYSRQINPLRRGTLLERVSRKGKGKVIRKRLSGQAKFGTFGSMMAEARLRQEGDDDPGLDERRRGDSDVDWGDEEEEGIDNAVVAEGMDLDPDLVGVGVTMAAMESFVDGVSGKGSEYVTMDDLEDRLVREELSGSDLDDSKDGDEEELISEEEMMLVTNFDDESDEDEEDEESSDEEGSPKTGFQARLDRLRKRQSEGPKVIGDEDSQEIMPDFRWEKESVEEYISGVEEFIDANNVKISNRNKIVHDQVFQAIRDGYFDVVEPVFSSSKSENVPPELREQWKKDRIKKAEKRQQRKLERLEALMDPLALKKGGKKSRKATIAAAKLDPSIEIPNRIVDMFSVAQQIRRFLADDSKKYMALPAADKTTRKKIHVLAMAFNLKSKSKNGASGRYTTLVKTKHSGFAINEKEIAGIMREFKARASYDGPDWKGKGKSKRSSLGQFKTQDGDVVGDTAPKIDEDNIGFKMLASMGWADGDTIGLSGGLDVPIAAVIKKTKLGVGAMKS